MIEGDPKHVARVEAFCEADKAHDIRLTYPLDQNSVVLDLGAYDCEWAKQICIRYGCNVHCFEPVSSCYAKAQKNIKGLEEIIHLYNFGLKNKTGFVNIFVNSDASSFHNITGVTEEVQVFSIIEVMKNRIFDFVDLIKMNIEGDEYEVLDALIEADMISRFGNLQIQFHRDVPGYIDKRNKIVDHLAQTHKRTYNYDFVWENWEKK